MSQGLNSSQRLRRLEQILATSRTSPVALEDERDAATRHLEGASLDRIRHMTALLESSDGLDDGVDAVTVRLLLNDYVVAVGHLRAVTRAAGKRLETATEPINETRRFLWRDEKLRESLRDVAAGLDDDTIADE